MQDLKLALPYLHASLKWAERCMTEEDDDLIDDYVDHLHIVINKIESGKEITLFEERAVEGIVLKAISF